MNDVRIGLCVDPVGSGDQAKRLCQTLKNHGVQATVTPAGTVAGQPVSTLDHLRPFLEGGHEIVNHTRSHPVRIGQLPHEEQEKELLLQHERLKEIGREFGSPFPVKGFRAPFYAYEEGIFAMLLQLGYQWDSSALYSPLLGVPFKPFKRMGIVEIPVLFPDDMTLLDRMLLEPEAIFQVWQRCFEGTGPYFVFTVHPYGSAKDDRALTAFDGFISWLKEKGGRFLTLSRIADEISREL